MRHRVGQEGFFGNPRLEWKGNNVLDVVFGDMFIEMFIDFEEIDIIGEDGEFGWKEQVLSWF